MRLNYNVLCIDDEIDSLADTKKSLIAHNEAVGISTNFVDQPVVRTARETNVEKFKERIFAEIDEKFKSLTFDLILVDLHIGENFKGGEVVGPIRNQTIYRPIIFFSGGQPAGEETAIAQLNDSIAKNNLAGKSVFLSTRGAKLNDDLRKICSEMHEEEHKINAGRGLLMDRTSEVDAKVLGHIRNEAAWSKLTAEQSNVAFKKIAKILRSKGARARVNSCILAKLGNGNFESFKSWLIGSDEKEIYLKFDSFTRNQILRELLRVQPDFSARGDTHSRYFKPHEDNPSISQIRNEYAHQTAAAIEPSHDRNRCKHIRNELRTHIENVNAISSL